MLVGNPVRPATSLAVMPLRVTFKTSKIMNAFAKDWLLEYGKVSLHSLPFSHIESIVTIGFSSQHSPG